jgi:oxygen-independent coproporphyrinogen-3 oxidase
MKGLYIHIPFCKSKCNYCGFYSVVRYDDELIKSYFNAILQDIESYQDLKFDTIYIGGGTPTVINGKMWLFFFNELFEKIKFSGDEFTVEINPESLKEEHLNIFNNFGVNRISIGVQSTNEQVLKFLGRIHKPDDVDNAISLIDKILPDCMINMDFIYDIPKIEEKKQIESLTNILNYHPDHISAYSYSFDTDFLFEYSEEEQSEKMFLIVNELLSNKHYIQYEVSNFAKTGCKSKHNMIYWKMDEYIGIGASSHSMLYNDKGQRVRFEKDKNVKNYIYNPTKRLDETVLSVEEMFKEEIVFGLRMIEGINLKKLKSNYGKFADNFIYYSKTMIDENLLIMEGDNLCVTQKGLLLLESLSEYFWSLEY